MSITFETRIKKTAPLVKVEWEDSVRDDGWVSFDSNDNNGMRIISVGYIIERTSQKTIIVPHLHIGSDGLPEGMNGRLVIPNTAIISTIALIEAPKEVKENV